MKNQILTSVQRQGFDQHYAGELGQVLANKVHLIKAKWNFATDGGAVGTIVLNDQFGNPVVIPNGALVRQVIINVTTAITSTAGTGTMALTLNTSGDLLAAIDADTISTIHAGIPVGTAATCVKATADRNLVLAIATNAMLTGAMDVYVEVYYVA